MKFLRRLRLTIIDLAHHPVIPPLHVDPNLDQPSSLAYFVKFSVHVVDCGVTTAHSTTHDQLQLFTLRVGTSFAVGTRSQRWRVAAVGVARRLQNVSHRQRRLAAERLESWHPEELTVG